MRPEDTGLNKESSALFSLPKKNVYEVPQDFFAEMERDIRRKYPDGKRAVYRKIRKWARLSIAAAIISLIIFSSIKVFFHKEYMPVETVRTIYTVEDGDRDGE
jgi:hypothetical protein